MFFLASSHILFLYYRHVFVYDQKNAFEPSTISIIIRFVCCTLCVCESDCVYLLNGCTPCTYAHPVFLITTLLNNTLRTISFKSLSLAQYFLHSPPIVFVAAAVSFTDFKHFTYTCSHLYIIFVVFTLVMLLTCYHCNYSFFLPVWWEILIYFCSFFFLFGTNSSKYHAFHSNLIAYGIGIT